MIGCLERTFDRARRHQLGEILFQRRYLRITLGALSMVALSVAPFSSSGSSSAPNVQWKSATGVRGLPAHDYLFGSQLFTVSCAAPGNCSAGGNYALSAKRSQAFVVNETKGVWGIARTVPGLTNEEAGPNTEVYAVSCPSPGNCSAGGSYALSATETYVFVVSEKGGRWGRAKKVRSPALIGTGDGSFITSISCASAGNCSAGGFLPVTGAPADSGAFVVNEVKGRWGEAQELTGPSTFAGGGAGVDSISCAAPGDCSAGGSFPVSVTGHVEPSFVVNETKGVWGRVKRVPGLKKLNFGESELRSVSCGAPGNCSAVGQFQQKSGTTRAYIVSESKGVWDKAILVPGLDALNGNHMSSLTTISCPSKGNCTAGGSYGLGNHQVAFTVTEKNGTWGTATLVPGLDTLNRGAATYVQTVSCPSKGNCGVSGTYSDAKSNPQSFVVNESHGVWGTAIPVRPTKGLKAIGTGILSIACATSSSCSAVGGFSAIGNNGALVVTTKSR